MRTQTKNKLFGILMVLVLTACVFLTLTPIALAGEPPVPELYEDGEVLEGAPEEPQPEIMPISAEDPQPELYEEEADESLEVMPAEEDDQVPTLYDDAPVPELISEEEPLPVLITEQPTSASKIMPTWSWVVIALAAVAIAALIIIGVRKRASAK
ncbi:MAG: hypothetical protein HN948_10070 [Clostridia bacterium]|jgi:hypothetical protein|nr:hypothetical protein [Clostridia bacterium]MBT7123340.1 hypothetical protein [Clostridia bacterium]